MILERKKLKSSGWLGKKAHIVQVFYFTSLSQGLKFLQKKLGQLKKLGQHKEERLGN